MIKSAAFEVGLVDGMAKYAARKKKDQGAARQYAYMAAMPVLGAGIGAGIKGLTNVAQKASFGSGAAHGGAVGAAVGLGAAGLIAMSRLLDKADPSGRAASAAMQMLPAAASVAGSMAQGPK